MHRDLEVAADPAGKEVVDLPELRDPRGPAGGPLTKIEYLAPSLSSLKTGVSRWRTSSFRFTP